jgi:phosphoribosylformimino-5-aminoimidazole carboxamide ribotide isomerase
MHFYIQHQSMRCVAVIDLKEGLVVHAVRGDRANYGPVRSRLTASAAPADVVAALRDRLGLTAFYVADLDAIQQRGSSRAIVAGLIASHPDCSWWIDAGFNAPSALEDYLMAPGAACVIGSECIREVTDYVALRAALPDPARAILSLDRRQGQFLGPAALWQQEALWPRTVIAMNLDRVGADQGPDLPLIARLKARAPAARIVAAGGVRDRADLAALAAAGASHVLVASALHAGRLVREDLAGYA